MKRIKDFIPEVYDYYFVDEDGFVYTDNGKKKLSDNAKQNGYIVNSFYGPNGFRKDIKRHKLMALIFLDPPENSQLQINHKDGNKTNNAVSNLEWCSSKENIRHAWTHNLAHAKKGSENNWAILDEQQVLKIADLIRKGISGAKIADTFNISRQSVSAIKCGHNWSHITGF